jgi:uncharacterized protein (DUF2062 family)
VYYAAWRVGHTLLDRPAGDLPPPGAADAADDEDTAWFERAWRRITGVGKPLVLGLAIFAVAGGLLSYLLVSGVWHLKVRLQRRRRLRRRPAA